VRTNNFLQLALVLTMSIPHAPKADESLDRSAPASIAQTSISDRRSQRGEQEACAPAIPELAKQHTRNWSRIWVVPISKDYEGLHFGKPIPINSRPGYNAQPSFSPRGAGLYFSWRPDNSQADIWYHDLKTGKERAITCTEEEEYQPKIMAGGGSLSVVKVGRDLVRHLSRIPLGSEEGSTLLTNLTSVAYYTWVDSHTLGLYLTEPDASSSMLAIADLRTGMIDRVTSKVGPTLAKVPARREISYVIKDRDSHSVLMAIDVDTRRQRFVVALPERVDTYLWLADGSLLAPEGSTIMYWSPGGTWKQVANFGNSGLKDIRGLVVSPGGGRLAIVEHIE